MATDLALDPLLLDQALQLSGEPTHQAAVTLALREFVARRGQQTVTELFGTLDWDAGDDHKAERSRVSLLVDTGAWPPVPRLTFGR